MHAKTLIALSLSLAATESLAQLRSQQAGDAEATTVMFQVGAIITAKGGPCRDINAMVAIPIECDEQTVKLVSEDFSREVAAVNYRELAGGAARQMLINIPFLDGGVEARAVLTYKVMTRTTPPTSDALAATLSIPRRVPRGLRSYIGVSPFIEAKHPKIKRLARSIREDFQSAGETSDWALLETVYDHVLDSIKYIEGPDTSALTTLKEESADCHGRSALFIALCRALGVPARMVWVQGHCYSEFYLEGPDKEGVWLPAESAGTRAFGEMPLARVIMQKGDDFRVPERPRERFRYATDFLEAHPAFKGGGPPSVKYVREIAR